MPKIVFVDAEGRRHEVAAETGSTVMETAVDNNIPGIVAECGGACACATCHAYIADESLGLLPRMEEMEDAMLDSAADRRPNSRLTCQLEVTDACEDLVVHVANNES